MDHQKDFKWEIVQFQFQNEELRENKKKLKNNNKNKQKVSKLLLHWWLKWWLLKWWWLKTAEGYKMCVWWLMSWLLNNARNSEKKTTGPVRPYRM